MAHRPAFALSSAHRSRPSISPSGARRSLVSQLFACCLCLLLFTNMLGGWNTAQANGKPPTPLHAAPASLTLQKYVQQGRADRVARGPLVLPTTTPPVPGYAHPHAPTLAQLPPSAEPAHMRLIRQALSNAFLSAAPGAAPLDLVGSDTRLEVQVSPGSLDLSHATLANGTAFAQPLALEIAQAHGHFVGQVPLLGKYSMQLVDAHGQVLQGVQVSKPFTLIYHYQPQELASLDLDPNNLFLTWPDLIATARAQHQAISSDLTVHLRNDPRTHTLHGQGHHVSPFDMGGGNPDNQSPPTPHMASVGGNSGQLAYSYPLAVAPGPPGTTPSLALTYSSSSSNERHSVTSPADSVGEGWSLSMGSISAEVYPGSSAGVGTWYAHQRRR